MLSKVLRDNISIYLKQDNGITELDVSKLSDSSYKLDIALRLKNDHSSIANGNSISRIIKTMIDEGVMFTPLEIIAIDKIMMLTTKSDKAYYGNKPQGYDIAVNYNILKSTNSGLLTQRIDNLSRIRNTNDYDSVNIETEIENCLVYSGLVSYHGMLVLSSTLFKNILLRG